MSHEGGADNSQRTVAELLAKYGADSGERAPRRRRRRDDSEDTGAQAIIDRVMSESGELAPIREDTPPPDRTPRRHRTGYQRPVEPPPPQRPVDPPPAPSPTRRHQPVQPPPPQPPQPQPRTEYTRPVGPPSAGRIPAIARSSEPTTPVRETRRQLPPQPQPRQQTSQRLPVQPPQPPPPPPQVEPTTEEMPRMPARLPVNDTHSRLAPAPYPESDPDRDTHTGYEDEQDGRREYDDYDRGDYPRDDYQGDDYERDDYQRDYNRDYDRDFELDEDLDDRELDDDEPREKAAASPAREWLVLAGQLALGVLGGAAVWLGFNWLWGFLPQAALVAALGVIVGLVLIVRKLRRAEDLLTTVLTVLVGLIVTVSPAPLLLIYQ